MKKKVMLRIMMAWSFQLLEQFFAYIPEFMKTVQVENEIVNGNEGNGTRNLKFKARVWAVVFITRLQSFNQKGLWQFALKTLRLNENIFRAVPSIRMVCMEQQRRINELEGMAHQGAIGTPREVTELRSLRKEDSRILADQKNLISSLEQQIKELKISEGKQEKLVFDFESKIQFLEKELADITSYISKLSSEYQ